MEIHKPKPIHSWLEFAKEYGIIVLGVLTALALEQALEAHAWTRKTDEAEQAMRLELGVEARNAFVRAAMGRCLDDQLATIITQVENDGDRAEVMRAAGAFGWPSGIKPPTLWYAGSAAPLMDFSWKQQAWDATVAADVGTHMGADRLSRWMNAYYALPLLAADDARTTDEIQKLIGGSERPGRLTPAERDRLLDAARALRRVNAHETLIALVFLRDSKPAGIGIPQADRNHLLAVGRRDFGACYAPPDLSELAKAR